MKTSFLRLATLCAVAALTTLAARAAEGWPDNYEKALAQAKTEKKLLLAEFTGSDWCPQCIVLTKNIFATEGFIDAATKKFILVELDVPFGGIAKPAGDVAAQNRNTKYSSAYRVNEFPMIILISPEGKEFHRFFPADFPKTDLLLKHLDEELAKKPANPS